MRDFFAYRGKMSQFLINNNVLQVARICCKSESSVYNFLRDKHGTSALYFTYNA